jgi:hypothetical protein
MVFLLLGMALVAVVVGAVAFAPSGDPGRLPDAVDSISPADGATVLRQAPLEVDMQPGFRIELFVDGVRIPEDQVRFAEATGRYTWLPAEGASGTEWAPGMHTVLIRWDRVRGLPEPGELRWTFRVQ